MQAASPDEVQKWHDWLVENGIEVLGPINQPRALSIYFHDPNGIRLEITTLLDPDWNRHTTQGYANLAAWIDVKERAQREGRDVARALTEFIREQRTHHRSA